MSNKISQVFERKLKCLLPQFASAQKPFLPFQHVVVVAPANTSNSFKIIKRSHIIPMTNFAFCCVVSLAYVLPQLVLINFYFFRDCLGWRIGIVCFSRNSLIRHPGHALFARVRIFCALLHTIWEFYRFRPNEKKRKKKHLSICMCDVVWHIHQSIDEHETKWNGIDWKKNATPWTNRNHTQPTTIKLVETYKPPTRTLPPMYETEICCSLCVAVSRSFHNSLIYVLCV